jgi:hypothetical protein
MIFLRVIKIERLLRVEMYHEVENLNLTSLDEMLELWKIAGRSVIVCIPKDLTSRLEVARCVSIVVN